VPEHEIHKITHANAMKAFRLDSFDHRPKEKCTAAALRAESPDVDLSLLTSVGGKPPRESGSGAITTQDVTAQLASAFAPIEE
jgi:hypothetical protein